MSGGIQESFDIRSVLDEKVLWHFLVKARQHKTMIGASIAPNPEITEARLNTGLVMGHVSIAAGKLKILNIYNKCNMLFKAYTMTKAATIEKNAECIKLVRLRKYENLVILIFTYFCKRKANSFIFFVKVLGEMKLRLRI